MLRICESSVFFPTSLSHLPTDNFHFATNSVASRLEKRKQKSFKILWRCHFALACHIHMRITNSSPYSSLDFVQHAQTFVYVKSKDPLNVENKLEHLRYIRDSEREWIFHVLSILQKISFLEALNCCVNLNNRMSCWKFMSAMCNIFVFCLCPKCFPNADDCCFSASNEASLFWTQQTHNDIKTNWEFIYVIFHKTFKVGEF